MNYLGWIGVLARWMRNPDIRVQVTAAKALANMDVDERITRKYETKVYPLYPLRRVRRKQQLDIVFIHGLLGGVFVTWRQKDPKEADLGLYGKNVDIFQYDCQDLFLVGEIIANNSQHIKGTIGGRANRPNGTGNNVAYSSWGSDWSKLFVIHK